MNDNEIREALSQARREFITRVYKNLCNATNLVPAECSCPACKVEKREARKALKKATLSLAN